MNTAKTLQIKSTSGAQTEQLGNQIGSKLRGGEVIELVSDLGGGKTTLVRGIAAGLGSKDKVASPSFTISKVYWAGDKQLHHFDFYRLQDAGITAHELDDVLGDPGVVVVVEWADAVKHVLPSQWLTIHINKTAQDDRLLDFSCPARLSYIIDGLC